MIKSTYSTCCSLRIPRASLQLTPRLSRQERQAKFITKAAWESVEINVHTLTSIFVLVSEGRLPPYAINTHLFCSQPCESTFRSARSLTGPFSSITNFTVQQFLAKVEKISALNQIKSIENNSSSPCALKFPTHQKNNHSMISTQVAAQRANSLTLTDIETLVIQAYDHARNIIKNISMIETLEKNGINDLPSLSSYVLEERKKSLQIDYSTLGNQVDDDGSADDDSDDENVTENFDSIDPEGNDYATDDHDDKVDPNDRLNTTKQVFNGMRIYDQIPVSQESHYFEVLINGVNKYVNKQTAARLLTVDKCRLSSDRLSRVQQSTRQR